MSNLLGKHPQRFEEETRRIVDEIGQLNKRGVTTKLGHTSTKLHVHMSFIFKSD